VHAAIERIVRQNGPFYTQQWTPLTAIQKKTLVAVVEEGGRLLQSQDVTRRIGTTPASVRKALLKLMDSNILREDAAAGETRYRFEDPFFARWIALFTAKL
jgi:Fe2+ or Zn2+ uptake regulation protein